MGETPGFLLKKENSGLCPEFQKGNAYEQKKTKPPML